MTGRHLDDTAEPMRRLLTIDEAAVYLSTTARHVQRLYHEHDLGFIRVGGRIRFRAEDLERFIEDHHEERMPR